MKYKIILKDCLPEFSIEADVVTQEGPFVILTKGIDTAVAVVSGDALLIIRKMDE